MTVSPTARLKNPKVPLRDFISTMQAEIAAGVNEPNYVFDNGFMQASP